MKYWGLKTAPVKCLLDLVNLDARHNMNLITQPLLMMAGSEADTLYMTQECFDPATGTENKELFIVDGARHIVYEPYQGKPHHLGQRLFKRLLDFARKKGITTIYLDTPKNTERAHRFYEKAGFVKIDESDMPDTLDDYHCRLKNYIEAH